MSVSSNLSSFPYQLLIVPFHLEDASVNHDTLITQGLLAGTRDGTGITDSTLLSLSILVSEVCLLITPRFRLQRLDTL